MRRFFELSSMRRSLTKDRCSSGESVIYTKDRCSSGESVGGARKLGSDRMLSLESFSAPKSLEKVLMMKRVARESVSFTESLKRSERNLISSVLSRSLPEKVTYRLSNVSHCADSKRAGKYRSWRIQ